jgi:hypothetical protein
VLGGAGNIYITWQVGTGFSLINPVEQTATGGDMQILVAALNPAGTKLLFSTTIRYTTPGHSRRLPATAPAATAALS